MRVAIIPEAIPERDELKPKFFALFIHGVEKASKHAFFVTVVKTAPKTAFGAFIGIQFFESVEETARPSLISCHLIPGLKYDKRI